MSEQATATKELKPISEMVLEMSKKITEQLTINKDGSTELKDEGIYLTLAKDAKLDEATIKKVRSFDDNFNGHERYPDLHRERRNQGSERHVQDDRP